MVGMFAADVFEYGLAEFLEYAILIGLERRETAFRGMENDAGWLRAAHGCGRRFGEGIDKVRTGVSGDDHAVVDAEAVAEGFGVDGFFHLPDLGWLRRRERRRRAVRGTIGRRRGRAGWHGPAPFQTSQEDQDGAQQLRTKDAKQSRRPVAGPLGDRRDSLQKP